MIFFRCIYKIVRRMLLFLSKVSWLVTLFKLKFNGIDFPLNFKSNGIPRINIDLKSKMSIGNYFIMNNSNHNMIGRQQPCIFVVWYGGFMKIGNNVGISSTAIVCWNEIIIEDNVRIGGGTVIYDTDFHSLNYKERINIPEIRENIKTSPVRIKRNVFIGANCTVLKGVTIGENSIIGACSVVTKNVPANEIWAGNPAKFIRKYNVNQDERNIDNNSDI